MTPRPRLFAPFAASARQLPDRGVVLWSRFGLAVAGAAAGLLLSLAGCNSTAVLMHNDAATETGIHADSATVQPVWPDNATKMVAEDHGGGFVGPAPAGSSCPALRAGTYTLTVADRRLAWHICTFGTVYSYVDGAKTLGDADYASLVAALKAVTLSTSTTCGADKSIETLTVTTPAGDAVYLDSFYVCAHQGTYVDHLDELFFVASNLAK
jgi:hypothetical protein